MKPLRLIKPSVCPPDGFRYVFPSTGFTVHAWDHDTWIANAKSHLQANNLPEPPDLVAQMETQLCNTLEEGWCNYDDPGRQRVSTVLSWGDVSAGIKTFSRWIAKGARFVDQAEADRRALICSRCYLNVQIQGCSACHAAAKEITANRKSRFDSNLNGCAVCKCLLRAKVHFPISVLDTTSSLLQAQYPDFCWLKRGGDNYRE